MKKVFLLMVVPVLLAALGWAQTPAASANTDPVNIKGCVSGSDGNYTVAEDNTGQIFKITGGSVDLKAHLGHEVKLVGHKASGAAGSGAAENSLAVTEVTMISEHCTPAAAAAAAAPAATVSAPADTTVTPAAAAPAASASTPADTPVAPAATIATPAATVTTPPADAPAAAVSTPAETAVAPAEPVITPPAAAAAPTEVGTPVETASTPVAASAHASRAAAHAPRSARRSAATAAAVDKPAETGNTPIVPTDATPAAAASTPAVSDSAPAAAATTPATAPATKAWSGSLWVLVSFVVVVLVIGAMVPLVNRWKKRRLLEQASEENLSFSHRAISDPGRSDKPTGRKAA